MADRPTVAVIGAGFSGVLTSVRLLLEPMGPRVLLIERGPRFGRGAAYSSASPHHLLNVRATNMSAFVEQPSHFIEWLGRTGSPDQGQAFVTRDRYGQYLQSILRRAAGQETGAARLVLEHDEVRTLARDGEGWRLELGVGRSLFADIVILALGNLPPPPQDGVDEDVLSSPRYAADPWAWDPASAPADGDFLLLGAGLTAVDVTLSIQEARAGARVLALSRHGLSPRPHIDAIPAAGPADFAPSGTPARVLRQVRAAAQTDWRRVIDALRPHVHTLWRGWSLAEKQRFLRHLRPWWDVYRHRLAPPVAARIADLRARGLFEVAAGRLRRLRADAQGVWATWAPRGGGPPIERRFAAVINCGGPRADLSRSGDALIQSLADAGLARPDDCRLGLDVDARSRVIGAEGLANDALFAIGPIARGHLFEITSVPDIRIQAADCASAVLNLLALRARRVGPVADPAAGLVADLAAFLGQSVDELDVELASLKFTRRVRNAWELRGRRAAFDEIALWLETRRGRGKGGS